MAVRTVKRRGERRLIIDIRFRHSDGTKGRYRKDAEVQTLAAARAEERRRLAALATTGSPLGGPAEPRMELSTVDTQSEAQPTLPFFKDIAEDYLKLFAPSHLKPSTRCGYAKVIQRLLIPKVGSLRLDQVNAQTMRALDAELVERGLRPSTRRNVQAVLRSVVCRYAVEAGLLASAPSFPSLPKVGVKVVDALTTPELERLLAVSCKAHRLAFMLAAHAGLRAGEVRGLRWRDVDLAKGRLVVRQSICVGIAAAPKSGRERIVPLTPELRELLERAPRPSRDALVSRNARGEPWSEFALGLAFGRVEKRAGLEG